MTRRDLVICFMAILFGLLAAALYLSVYHLYLDHRFVDDIRTQIQTQQQSRKP